MSSTDMSNASPEMQALKSKLKATWMAGDYGHFAKFLEPDALAFLARLDLKPGSTRLLDVACGAGQIVIPAARAGIEATGVDIATNSILRARERAAEEGLTALARFDEGDAEALPYADASFDVVSSLFGAMFAPRPERVAAELLRVCRPGGRIVMGNWTPQAMWARCSS
jgi:ubiquinone/menaquinone biosynthesis C-methylase UbiE